MSLAVPEGYAEGKCIYSGARSRIDVAVRESDSREVLLKTYLDTGDPGYAKVRAEREFGVLRQLSGAGVAEALELVGLDDQPVLVLERTPGISLRAWVGGGLPDAETFLEVALQLCEVLVRMHGARLLHRDISPDNVLVDPTTRGVHLIDFELSRPLGAAVHGSGTRLGATGLVGSLDYVSPEATAHQGKHPVVGIWC